MAKTLLSGVNDVLKRVQVIQGDSGALASLTDSGRQGFIDLAVQTWNEAVEKLYETSRLPVPQELAENTITLASGDRDYALQSDLVMLRWPLIDETNGRVIEEFKGGYMALVNSQLRPSNFTGIPYAAAIRPTDGELYLDRIPQAEQVGLVYKYRYDKDVSLSLAADTFPFTDAVYRAMIPAVAEMWKKERHREFDFALYNEQLAIASRQMKQIPPRASYLHRPPEDSLTDPFDGN